MDEFLVLPRQRGWTDHAEVDFDRVHLTRITGIVAQPQVEPAGIGPVVEDRVGSVAVARGEHRLSSRNHHVARGVSARMQGFEDLIQLSYPVRQTGVVGIVLEVGRNPGKLDAIGVAIVGAVEQVVLEIEIVEIGVPCERLDAGGALIAQAGFAVPGQNWVWRQGQKNNWKAEQ
ncbi:hypothetical protein SCD_n01823 [Sulfuricella denitrificans skB26]|uniref:Uncharacterized protein n=1 Tax=Sulfuricella denitrificans (strain DSM 22764 / NBRC 105220 / skB26) TaxID=1163617 RepID=S6ALR2_SULDS|nr:hypothetical protein [Sulfuricella denitrificans]BAN35634.1 hypothetical protein SCD_n01823 [Sulfuricella denitrificans skB26]